MARARDSRGRFTSGGSGDPLESLADEAQGAADALDELTDSAKKAQPALKGAGEKAKKAAKSTNIFARALGEAASDALTKARQALTEWVRDLPEAAARAEAHAATLERLGLSYGAVQQATNGAVSAEQAAAVQQRALQSGLRLSAQELAAVTARARDFARTTGTDLDQALEQLTDQLIDPGEELRKFGVFLQTGMSAGDALRETLRQLQAQTASSTTSQVSLNEAMEQAKRATTEATDSLSAMLAKELELRDFFLQYATWVNDARQATSGWRATLDAIVGTIQEVGAGQARIAGAQNQSASGAFVEQASGLAASLRNRGVAVGFDINRFAVQATPRQRDEMLQFMRQTMEATTANQTVAGTRGVGGGAVQDYVDPSRAGSAETPSAVAARLRLAASMRALASTAQTGFEEQQRADAEARAAAERERLRELARRNRASQSASSSTQTAPDLAAGAFAQLRADPAGLQSFLGALAARAQAQALEQRGGTIATRLAGVDLQRQSSEATSALDVAGQSRPGFMGGMFSADAGRRETQQRTERTRVIREQREALAALLVEAQREEDTARRMGRPVAEVNDLIRQRIGIQTALAQSTRDLVASQEEQVSGFAVVGEKMLGVLDGVADGIGESIVAALEGSKSIGEAMEEMVRSTLRALAKLAIVEALKEGAMAVAALATYRYDAAVQHGIAAGMWAGVGVVAGAGVAAMGSGAKPAAASGGGASASTATGGGRAARADDRASTGGPLTIVLNVSGAAFTDAGVQHAATAAVREAVGNGVLRREHLAPLLGADHG